jgi:hypothetical protein
MSTSNGGKIVKDGLVFQYDMNDRNSWKGKPTTNLCYQRNPIGRGDRKDYLKSTNTSDATFNSNHPGRIKFTTANNGEIGDMINSGVNGGNWQVTYHAHWQYDEELRKPVCVMNDVDGQWKAHSFNTGYTLNSLGWSEGQQYTISWLGWTTRIDKAPNTGIYYRRTSDNSRGFYAGLSNSQSTAFNTEPYKWQRLYATFTVPAGMDGTYVLGMYCYGHYVGRGTVKMVDLQWEEGTPSHFVENNGRPYQTRSNTDALIDLVGRNTITTNSLTYNSDGTFSFNGASDYIDLPNDIGYTSQVSAFGWFKSAGTPAGNYHIILGGQELEISIYTTGYLRTGIVQGSRYVHNHGSGLTDGNWHQVGFTFDGSTKVAYIDGVSVGTDSIPSGTLTSSFSNRKIGRFGSSGTYYVNGEISQVKIYNKALTASEIQQNFNALRGRYGL